MEKENKNEMKKRMKIKIQWVKYYNNIKKQLDQIHKELGNYSQKDYTNIKKNFR